MGVRGLVRTFVLLAGAAVGLAASATAGAIVRAERATGGIPPLSALGSFELPESGPVDYSYRVNRRLVDGRTDSKWLHLTGDAGNVRVFSALTNAGFRYQIGCETAGGDGATWNVLPPGCDPDAPYDTAYWIFYAYGPQAPVTDVWRTNCTPTAALTCGPFYDAMAQQSGPGTIVEVEGTDGANCNRTIRENYRYNGVECRFRYMERCGLELRVQVDAFVDYAGQPYDKQITWDEARDPSGSACPPPPCAPGALADDPEVGSEIAVEGGSGCRTQWQRCRTVPELECFDITGATEEAYLPSIADLGLCLRANVGSGATTNLACYVRMPLTNELTAALAFRPHLLFDSDERLRPLNLNYLFTEHGNTLCHVFAGAPDSCTAPGPISFDGCELFFGPGCLPTAAGPQLSGYDYVDVDHSASRTEPNTGPGSTVYYNHTTRHGTHYLDYWFFYRSNDHPVYGASATHEGDWEGVVVATRSLDPAQEPSWVAFAQHKGAPKYYLPDIVDYQNGRHPVAYVANGSHASYPYDCAVEPCWQDVAVLPLGGRLREGRFDGHAAWGWNGADDCARVCVLPLPELTTDPSFIPPAPTSWNSWTGHWGRKACLEDAFGTCTPPGSPGWQGRYEHPWVFDETQPAQFFSRAATAADACAAWFGYGIRAVACEPSRVEQAMDQGSMHLAGDVTVAVRGSGGVSPTAPGLAQLAGDALVAGAVIEVEGRLGSASQVLLRLAGVEGPRDVMVDGSELGLADGGRKAIVVRSDGTGELTARPNALPTCAAAVAQPAQLWPPNGDLHLVSLAGVVDPDGDATSVSITRVLQDEPLTEAFDAKRGDRDDQVMLRAARQGGRDGRVYRIAFTATDGIETCTGAVEVGVGHDVAHDEIDSGPQVDSFGG